MGLTGKVVVISPHFDDAVLSCGDWLAACPGSTVLTVYSGVPPSTASLPDWDRRCGFERADQAAMARHEENRAAMAVLGARGLGLGLLDEQYEGPVPETGRITGMLATALTTLQPAVVLVPLGLFHRDHLRVSDASLTVWRLFRAAMANTWLAYEEALYRRKPGLVQQRLATLQAERIQATPIQGPRYNGERKRRAVAAYASQLDALELTPGQGDDAAPESYWRLEIEGAAH
ncbi:PIG-L deacetylase family protein [Bordetella sp. BOR01]|uniref:PIG-L deacetylase family protein n=1 Tax=Bordetella sp. BOR01 TaxID=2854779 RepID=UPI001C467DEF|nr:PIG-L family deacetylase [Bordetella sp. BOR01]MBV7486116.1 PIG-L family deacetylase [Bordetella sp. BOR01]